MIELSRSVLDLTPPPFAEGLCDWSRGDGTPTSPTYETGDVGRIARNDPDFGECLELRVTRPVQRLRYMGEMPLRAGAHIEIAVRIKALRGPLAGVRIAATPCGFGGVALTGLAGVGPIVRIAGHDAVTRVRAVIGRAPGPGVDIVWDERVLIAHVGLDLVGPGGGVFRIENFAVRERRASVRSLPGFERVAP